MSLTRKNKKEKVREPRTKITWKEVKRQKVLLFWAAIMVAYGVVFYYLPLAAWEREFKEGISPNSTLRSLSLGSAMRASRQPWFPQTHKGPSGSTE